MTTPPVAKSGAQPAALYLFIGSDRPDVYVNSIAHCLGENPQLHVVLVHVLEDRGRLAESSHRLEEVATHIQELLGSLIRAEYVYWTREGYQKRAIQLEQFNIKRYSQLHAVALARETIHLKDLASFVRKSAQPNAIFDVSAAPKAHLIRLVALVSAVRTGGLFLFEILRQVEDRPFDERELIHSLTLGKDYQFRNLLDDKVLPRLGAVDQLYVEDLSRGILAVITLVLGILVFAFAFGAFALDWNALEPISFVIFGLPIALFLKFLFATFGQRLSFDPFHIEQVAVKWARKRYERKTSPDS